MCIRDSINFYHYRYPYEVHYNEYQEYIEDRTTHLNQLKKTIITLDNFKYLFYSLKYKEKFRAFFWEKIRLPKIQEKYHPANLQKLIEHLTEEDDINELLEKW